MPEREKVRGRERELHVEGVGKSRDSLIVPAAMYGKKRE